jgi:hypothetical protein
MVFLSGSNLASANALAAVYVREGRPRELVRKRRKPSTTAERPLLGNGRHVSRAGKDRASAYYPFYGVDEDAIEYWRPAAEHNDRKQQRRKAIARGKAQGCGYPDEPDVDQPWARPTHVQATEEGSWWMSYIPTDIAGEIAAHIRWVSMNEHDHYCIYPLPANADVAAEISPVEWIQTTGTGRRLTAEIRRRDADNAYRVYVIGRGGREASETPSETIEFRGGPISVCRRELLTPDEVTGLFRYYHEHHAVPPGWCLRSREEFATAAD